jgi:hypothetical protein
MKILTNKIINKVVIKFEPFYSELNKTESKYFVYLNLNKNIKTVKKIVYYNNRFSAYYDILQIDLNNFYNSNRISDMIKLGVIYENIN